MKPKKIRLQTPLSTLTELTEIANSPRAKTVSVNKEALQKMISDHGVLCSALGNSCIEEPLYDDD